MARPNTRTAKRSPKDLNRRIKKKPCQFCRDNTVWIDYKDLGTATSLAAFFRSMGGAFGTALLGAVLNDRLVGNLSAALPVGSRSQVAAIAHQIVGSPAQLQVLPRAIHTAATIAYVHTIDTVFLIATPVVAVAFLLSFALPEIRLRKSVHGEAGSAVPTAEIVEMGHAEAIAI